MEAILWYPAPKFNPQLVNSASNSLPKTQLNFLPKSVHRSWGWNRKRGTPSRKEFLKFTIPKFPNSKLIVTYCHIVIFSHASKRWRPKLCRSGARRRRRWTRDRRLVSWCRLQEMLIQFIAIFKSKDVQRVVLTWRSTTPTKTLYWTDSSCCACD